MRRLRELTIVFIGLALLGFGTGCFVFEEIDKGQEEMRKHSPEAKKTSGTETANPVDLAALKKSGADKFGNIQQRVEEAMRPEPHPDDVVVNCRLDGRTQYMRKFSCQTMGGYALNR